jgi:hypothetical protein
MLEKIIIMKAVDYLIDLLEGVAAKTDNDLDDKVIEAVKVVKDEVEKGL